MVTKENQIKFYSEELKELEFSVKKVFNATGWTLYENGDVYVGQYRGKDEKRGNVFVDIPYGKQFHSPRIDQKFTCFTVSEGSERPSTWKNIIYSDLLKGRNRSESKLIDYIPSKRDGWITMLLRELDSEFVEGLQFNQILAFGPTIPPFEYLQNLQEFSESLHGDENPLWSKILNFKFELSHSRQPKILTEETDIAEGIIQELNNFPLYVFQGPPGTGKTHQTADIVARLVLSNHSVLITALTNKAAIEVCEKSFFEVLFKEGRVSKLPLSIDERIKFPKLLNTKDLVASKGHLTLCTFYQFSRIWQTQTQTFDYVVVEEASQAFLTTIAAACKVGKKVIVVGDPKQILPIVTNKNFKVYPNIDELINGMNTLSQITELPFYRKIETRRLTERATEYTNCFYQNSILSKSLFKDLRDDKAALNDFSRFIHPKGGPSLILFSNDSKNVTDLMFRFLVESIDELASLKDNSIAVLTPYIETLSYLQQNLKSKTKSKNYLIETVDRVQGLDVDYCFYVVPKSSSFSYNLNRFNVATSRTRKSTFILAEENFSKTVKIQNEVANYLSKLEQDFCFFISSDFEITASSIIDENKLGFERNNHQLIEPNVPVPPLSGVKGLTIIGKIDVSKFKRDQKELKKDKENLYIIDTNVFVNYPEIITTIKKEYPIVLSAKVLDELDNLKSTLDSEGKLKVQKALKSINQNIDNRDVRMEIADLTLLPMDFNKRSPDNFILSVALKFKTENPILLTSDNGLQIKAKGLAISTITLKEFLNQRKSR